jgi:hypothetical protein
MFKNLFRSEKNEKPSQRLTISSPITKSTIEIKNSKTKKKITAQNISGPMELIKFQQHNITNQNPSFIYKNNKNQNGNYIKVNLNSIKLKFNKEIEFNKTKKKSKHKKLQNSTSERLQFLAYKTLLNDKELLNSLYKSNLLKSDNLKSSISLLQQNDLFNIVPIDVLYKNFDEESLNITLQDTYENFLIISLDLNKIKKNNTINYEKYKKIIDKSENFKNKFKLKDHSSKQIRDFIENYKNSQLSKNSSSKNSSSKNSRSSSKSSKSRTQLDISTPPSPSPSLNSPPPYSPPPYSYQNLFKNQNNISLKNFKKEMIGLQQNSNVNTLPTIRLSNKKSIPKRPKRPSKNFLDDYISRTGSLTKHRYKNYSPSNNIEV